MGDPRGGPDVPPEIPPPWRPEWPDEPDRPHPAIPVPLVPARDEQGRRENAAGRLLEHRIVMLFGPLDSASATRVAAQVMTLDAEADAEIRLHLSCEDGELAAALTLADTVDLVRSPVLAHARGAVGGVGLAPFCAAARRLAGPETTFRLSEPTFALSGDSQDVLTGADEVRRQAGLLHARVVAATGRPQQEVAADMARGRVLDAREALDYGLIDAITVPPDRGRYAP